MKHFILTLFLFIVAISVFSQTKVDTIVTQKWNGSIWQDTGRLVNTYNTSDCALTSTLLQNWDLASSTWQNVALTTYTYGSNDTVSQALLQTWNILTNTWEDQVRSTNTYEGSSKKLVLTSNEGYILGSWTPVSKTSYSYDSNNYLDSTLTQLYLFGLYTNSLLTINTNNSDGTPNVVINKTWNFLTLVWENYSRNTYTYSGSIIPTTFRTELWQSNAWVILLS